MVLDDEEMMEGDPAYDGGDKQGDVIMEERDVELGMRKLSKVCRLHLPTESLINGSLRTQQPRGQRNLTPVL